MATRPFILHDCRVSRIKHAGCCSQCHTVLAQRLRQQPRAAVIQHDIVVDEQDQIVLDQIISDIEKTGSHESFTVALLNGPFTEDRTTGPSFTDQVQNWANRNKLRYEFFQKKDSAGKYREAIRFYSEVPRIPPLASN